MEKGDKELALTIYNKRKDRPKTKKSNKGQKMSGDNSQESKIHKKLKKILKGRI